jgi:hypothetical protein
MLIVLDADKRIATREAAGTSLAEVTAMIDVVLLVAVVALVVLVTSVAWTALSDRADRRSPRRPAVWDDAMLDPGDNIVFGKLGEPKFPPDDTKTAG